MANPVLRRSAFHLREWQLFIPADKDARYYSRYIFGPPGGSGTSPYDKIFVLRGIDFGQVFAGQEICPQRDLYHATNNPTGKWRERSGYWSNASAVGAWNNGGRQCSSPGAFVTVDIPASHNLIKICADVYNGTYHGGIIQLAWVPAMDSANGVTWAESEKDGLDITEQDLEGSTSHNLTEFTVATNAAAGTRKLRIWRKGTESDNLGVVIVAVRSWDTRTAGDPATAVSGIAVGHNMIDTIANCTTASLAGDRVADRNMVNLSQSGIAFEFAIANGPADHATLFTGGQAHFNDAVASYEYKYGAGTFTDGPTILLGTSMTDKGGMGTDGVTVNPKGTVYTDEQIHIRSIGYPLWIEANPPKIIWTYGADKTALSFNVALVTAGAGVDFDATGAIDGLTSQAGQYCTMFALNQNLTGYWKIPSESTRNIFPTTEAASADLSKEGVGAYEVYPDGWPVKIKCQTTGNPYRVFFWGWSGGAKKWKLYCQMWPGNWGVTKSGTPYQMADGGAMSFGGRYEVSFEDPAFNAGWSRTRYGNPVV